MVTGFPIIMPSREQLVKPRQLAFDLPVDSRHGVEDFLVGPSNEQAYGLIESWPNWPSAWLRLVGPEGAGKTHLAAIWAARAHAWTVQAAEIDEAKVPHLASGGALVIEDCDHAPLDEPALFHLLNATRARGASVLLTARSEPGQWGLKVPDLLSRLRLAPQAEISSPDDALLRALLVKLFVDRQLIVDTGTIEALALRMERSFAAARDIVDALDRLSLRARPARHPRHGHRGGRHALPGGVTVQAFAAAAAPVSRAWIVSISSSWARAAIASSDGVLTNMAAAFSASSSRLGSTGMCQCAIASWACTCTACSRSPARSCIAARASRNSGNVSVGRCSSGRCSAGRPGALA